MWFRTLLGTLLARSSRTRSRKTHPAPGIRRRLRSFLPLLDILEDRTLLSTYTVNSLTDSGTGSRLTGDLRYCITKATSGSDTITFAPGLTGTINVESALPALNASVAIQGPGASTLTVNNIPPNPVDSSTYFTTFAVGSTSTVEISGLGITGVYGDAISNAGTLTVSACNFGDWAATNNKGTLTLSACIFSQGGPITNSGTLTVSNCTFNGGGDAIANSGTATVSNSTFEDYGGGALFNTGVLTLNYCTLSGNASYGSNAGRDTPAADGHGGAIFNQGALTINNSTLTNNIVKGGDSYLSTTGSGGETYFPPGNGMGGGIYMSAGTLPINSSTLSDNQALGATSGGANGYGGGLYLTGGTVSINNSTFADNQAIGSPDGVSGSGYGGGLYEAGGTLSINSSTLSGNQALGADGTSTITSGFVGSGYGGGLYLANGGASINNSTVADNQAIGSVTNLGTGPGFGGGISIAAILGDLPMYDTILADNSASTAAADLDGNVASLGHNLIGNSVEGSGFVASDLLNVNPLLGPLQNNGGPTQTMALLPDSPAIAAGDTSGAPLYDQRGPGFPRIVNDFIDIGAFEVQTTTSTAPTVTSVISTQGPTSGGTSVTITGSNLGTMATATVDFGTGHPGTIVSDSGSQIVAMSPSGTGTVNVTVTTVGGTSSTSSADQFTYLGPLTQYLVSTLIETPTVTAGSPFLVTVQAADQYNDPITTGFSGPSTVTVSITTTSGASTFPMTLSIGSNGEGQSLAVLPTVGTYTLTAAAGSYTSNAPTVTVTAAPAAKLAFAAQPLSTPTGLVLPTVSVQVQDAYGNVITSDNSDSVTLAVASGPGSFLAGSTTTATVHNGVATFSNLTLVAPGSYTLSAIVPGLYTGHASNAFSVLPLQVVAGSFAGTPSGFSLSFNAPYYVNTTILNPLGGANVPALYGSGFGAGGIKPSVTLTQTTGKAPSGFTLPYHVAGSLVLNPATNSLQFIATNDSSYQHLNGTPVLPDGNYTVTVYGASAGATGFQALNAGGGYLDGLMSGNAGSGNWTTTFTVGAGAANDEVVWLPATATGPGLPLEAPGYSLSGGGEPIYLYDPSSTPGQTGDVTSVTGTLTYNPSYLTVTSGMGGPYLTIHVTSPGVATFAYSGPPVTFNPVTYNSLNPNGLNNENTRIASTPLGYLNWSGDLLNTAELGSAVGLSPAMGSPGLSGSANGVTYYYELASVANGMISPASAVVSVTVPAGDSDDSILLSWPQDLVATGYNLYRTTTTVSGVPQFSAASSLLAGNIPYTENPNIFGYQYQDSGAVTPGMGTLPPAASSFAQATVPNGTAGSALSIYQGKDVLTVSNVVVKTATQTLPSIGDSAVHLVAYLGDADGNGIYTSGGNAVELTRVHAQVDSGFPAYPDIDPVILGDIDNPDLGVFSGDTAFEISELSVGSTPDFVSPKPNSVQVGGVPGAAPGGGTAPYTILPVGNGIDPTLTLPTNLQVGADGTVVVPVNIDDARPAGSTGLVEADLALTYNPSLFTVSASDVHAGSVLAGGTWSVVSTIDQATGQIGIVLSSSTRISSSVGGSLVTIDFHAVEPSGGRQPPDYSGQAQFELAAYVTPNGQYIPTELEDSQGAFILTPAPTNSFNPRIDGVVTLTAPIAEAPLSTSPAATSAIEFQSDIPTVNAPIVDNSDRNISIMEFEQGEPELAAVAAVPPETEAERVRPVLVNDAGNIVMAPSALTSISAATLASAPLTGLMFFLSNAPVVNAPGWPGQQLANSVFPAFAQGPANPGVVSRPGTLPNVFEGVSADRPQWPEATTEDPNWDEANSDLDWLGIGQPIARWMHHGRRDAATDLESAPRPVSQIVADRDALDQYFIQVAEGIDQTAEDE